MSDKITTSDGFELHLHDWPAEQAKLTVMLLHGYGEHAGRYKHVAEHLNAQDIAMIGADLRGHGRSQGGRGYAERFEDYHRDAQALLARVQQAETPVALMGHSMGGLVALHWLLSGENNPAQHFKGLVLSSPFMGLNDSASRIEVAAGKLLSKVLPKISLPAPHKGKDVCRDPEIGAEYDQDPLNNRGVNARWFTAALDGMRLAHGRASELALPTLMLYGGADKVVSVSANDRLASSLGMSDKTVERLEGYFHEIMNEAKPERDQVLKKISDWLLERAEAKTA